MSAQRGKRTEASGEEEAGRLAKNQESEEMRVDLRLQEKESREESCEEQMECQMCGRAE